jgi:hypothetical protein
MTERGGAQRTARGAGRAVGNAAGDEDIVDSPRDDGNGDGAQAADLDPLAEQDMPAASPHAESVADGTAAAAAVTARRGWLAAIEAPAEARQTWDQAAGRTRHASAPALLVQLHFCFFCDIAVAC